MNKNYKSLLEKHGYLKIKNVLNFDYDLKPILNDMEFVMNELILKFVSIKLHQKILKYDFKKKYSYISKLKIHDLDQYFNTRLPRDHVKKDSDYFATNSLWNLINNKKILNVVEKINLPVLPGIHIRDNGKLSSGETITKMFEKCKSKNWLGLIVACASPEIIENTVDEIKALEIPFGFKANLWKEQPLPVSEIVKISDDGFGENPVDVLGTRKDITGDVFCDFSRRMLNKGATILGGCCETKPSHISAISKLKLS
mgnify:CR=1 FL=1